MVKSYARSKKIKLISAEICEDAIPIDTYKFNYISDVCLVVGNESTGVPIEILLNSDKIYIPMPGVGFCLNTSQAANIVLVATVSIVMVVEQVLRKVLKKVLFYFQYFFAKPKIKIISIIEINTPVVFKLRSNRPLMRNLILHHFITRKKLRQTFAKVP